jgi:hypothetical protein
MVEPESAPLGLGVQVGLVGLVLVQQPHLQCQQFQDHRSGNSNLDHL